MRFKTNKREYSKWYLAFCFIPRYIGNEIVWLETILVKKELGACCMSEYSFKFYSGGK